MFGWFRPARQRHRPAFASRTRLGLEQLETRDCPAAPVLTAFSATRIADWLVIEGTVSDEQPGTTCVTLGGATSGYAMPDANGHFSHAVAWPGGTQVTAVVSDDESLTSDQGTATIQTPTDANPFVIITDVTYTGDHVATFTGRVCDESPEGLEILIEGVGSGSVTADANGDFTVTLLLDEPGTVYFTTTDGSSQASNNASAILTNSAPVIENFACSEEADGWFHFAGRVVDEQPWGLTVYFGGMPVSLAGQSCTVAGDGWFDFMIQLNGTTSDEGMAQVQVWDWWGVASNIASFPVHQTGV